ncbi:MAG: cytochrome c biogenesis protein CcdA [Chloroflexi bacterium]|nr:cytochrome c biogenesis protein CcdA [Chloroflexota bacterium]
MTVALSPWLWPLAFIAGLVSFFSPCTFPLLPGYLSFITGFSVSEVGSQGKRWASLRACLLFVLGFTLAFSALGASASAVGSALDEVRPVLEKVAGIFILVMAAFLIGIVKIPAMQGEWRWRGLSRPGGAAGAVFLGAAFALGWTPCIGPVLAAVLAVAGTQAQAAQGALLLALYAMGLGLPFVVAGAYFAHVAASLRALRRFLPLFSYAGAAMLAIMGVLLLSDHWLQLMAPLLQLYGRLNWPSL